MPRKTKDNPLGLEPYEGQVITELGIEIPSAAGGFRKPLECDESLLDVLAVVKHGDTIYAVLELCKKKVRHEPAESHDGWKRVDIFEVNGVAVIDQDLAYDQIVEQRDRVQAVLDRQEKEAQAFKDQQAEKGAKERADKAPEATTE